MQAGNESLTDNTARALGISVQELRAHFEQGTISKVLLERFANPE